jgi:hypothetical protein
VIEIIPNRARQAIFHQVKLFVNKTRFTFITRQDENQFLTQDDANPYKKQFQ